MNQYFYFCSGVYQQEFHEHLDAVKIAAEQAIKRQDLNEIYPVYMSDNFAHVVPDFSKAVAQMAWDILDTQGYNVSNMETIVGEMWMQEHYRHSGMEQHVHPGAQMVGFYFLESPENCSRPVFHDPRPGKSMMDLPEKDASLATLASNMINFDPTPGNLILTNGYVPHSFTRHGSDAPIKFVHINIYTRWAESQATVI